jgi:NADH-quinone oxidoreductase subunit I
MIIQYKKKRGWIGTIIQIEILKGMALTLRKMFTRAVTRQYPKERPEIFTGFRGQHALARNPETGASRCVACMRCATVCPSQCIHIDYTTDEETGARIVDKYEIESLRCIYCGYCEEVCPVNAITLTEVYEYASYDRESVFYDEEGLLKNWDRFIEESGKDPKTYVNPFWRPRGADEKTLPADNRLPVPEDWTLEGQAVGWGKPEPVEDSHGGHH